MKSSIPDTLLAWAITCLPQKHRFVLQYILETELAIGISLKLLLQKKETPKFYTQIKIPSGANDNH